MKHILNDQQRSHLDQRIAEAEKRTGAQIVLAVIRRSDTYAELPWKAFALGVSITGFAVAVQDMLRPAWTSDFSVMLAVAVTLAAGAVFALLCISVPAYARLFLDVHRAEAEVRQYAQSLFLSRELFATHQRTGLLLLVSLFERQVVILPDSGLHKRLSREAMQQIIKRMGGGLASGQVACALEDGLDGLERILASPAPGKHGENELPNSIIEEKGP